LIFVSANPFARHIPPWSPSIDLAMEPGLDDGLDTELIEITKLYGRTRCSPLKWSLTSPSIA
jgi:hypothetical protein